MRKIIYILIGIATFSVGFWIFQLRPLVIPVSICEITRHAEIFESKQIRVKAFLGNVRIDDDGTENFSVSDLEEGCLTSATLEISEQLKSELKSDESLQQFISELRSKNDEEDKKRDGNGMFVAEIEIVGEIRKIEETGIASVVSPPPFIIKTTEIAQTSPIRFVSYKEIRSFEQSK